LFLEGKEKENERERENLFYNKQMMIMMYFAFFVSDWL
jgi:hypothetical protein